MLRRQEAGTEEDLMDSEEVEAGAGEEEDVRTGYDVPMQDWVSLRRVFVLRGTRLLVHEYSLMCDKLEQQHLCRDLMVAVSYTNGINSMKEH